MARTKKNTRRIDVRGTEYRWIVRVYWGTLNGFIWPANDVGQAIRFDTPFQDDASGSMVVTNRLIRRIIEYVLDEQRCDPEESGETLVLRDIQQKVDLSDAVYTQRG